LLNRLIDSNLSSNDMIVLLLAIRKAISSVEEPPVKEILKTNILSIMSQLFTQPDNHEDIRTMKLEGLWILTNLAYGDEADI
jgi:hypothetical protein